MEETIEDMITRILGLKYNDAVPEDVLDNVEELAKAMQTRIDNHVRAAVGEA